MKKLLLAIFCHRTIEVRDALTYRRESATYYMIFGFNFKITYRSLS